MTVHALTRVAIKRCKRTHPDWTDERVFEYVNSLTDPGGPYSDQVTLLDVQCVLSSMVDEYPRELFKWNP